MLTRNCKSEENVTSDHDERLPPRACSENAVFSAQAAIYCLSFLSGSAPSSDA